eukprot:3122686-Pyramimonas_sp.AAC.1
MSSLKYFVSHAHVRERKVVTLGFAESFLCVLLGPSHPCVRCQYDDVVHVHRPDHLDLARLDPHEAVVVEDTLHSLEVILNERGQG